MSQVILFDLDGTLTESGEGIINCVQYALEKLGKKEEHPENLQCFIGPPLKEQFMKYAGLSEEEGEKAVVYYRERYTTTGIFENRLYPKIPELLELLKINNKILAVASSKPEVYVKQILEHFQIADYFTAIVGSELDGRRTEKAEVIEEALRRMHLEEERDKVLMVGDRSHDVQGAISCGLQCIGVAYGYGSREELEKAGAVYIADSVEDLGILASPNDEETTENVESVRNIIPDREKVKKYEIPETRKLEKEEKEMNEKAMEILKVFDLDKEADTLAGNLPYGKQRKLEIARALATNPKLLLLDEPAAGMNPNETQELMDTIRFVQKHFDMTILLIEHDMKLVGGICEEVTVLNFGQVLAQGETSKVLKDPAVITAYLGE